MAPPSVTPVLPSSTSQLAHQCLFCSKYFKVYKALELHMNLHTGEHPYQCTECPANFTDNRYLGHHLTEVHHPQPKKSGKVPKNSEENAPEVNGRPPSIFKCTQCPSTHVSRNQLLQHAAISHNLKLFKCPSCPNIYTKSFSRSRHMKRSHPTVKPPILRRSVSKKDPKCTECHLKFSTYPELQRHKKDKHNLKMYKCDLCSNEYTRHPNMLRHREASQGTLPEPPKKLFSRLPREPEQATKKIKSHVTHLNERKEEPSGKVDQYPVLVDGSGPEGPQPPQQDYTQLLEMVSQLKIKDKEKYEKDVSFFLHMNRYDPSAI